MDQKSVRVLGLNSMWLKRGGRKVLEIFRHNDVSAAGNCGCKHVPVIKIRKRQARDQMLVIVDETIWQSGVHCGSPGLNFGGIKIGTV